MRRGKEEDDDDVDRNIEDADNKEDKVRLDE